MDSPPSSPPVSLFRQEVVEFQKTERQFGRPVLLQPLSTKVLSWLIAGTVAVIVAMLVLGQYSRKATVSGYLTLESGTAKIFVSQRGVITQVHVTDGQEVEKGQPLLTIDTTQISATGEDANSVILTTLRGQRGELKERIAGEEQRMGSERERLTLLIAGMKTQIAHLEAQIPLQQDRINLGESLVASIVQLAERGVVTTVELRRRQAEVLEQKENLSSLNRQVASQQNQLTDTQYTLNQLPIATAEKIQNLRNELSAVEQRIAEINARRAFVVRAPIPGRVSALQGSVGKVAELNQLQLEIVPSSSSLRAELLVPSRAIGFVRVGQRVSVRYEAFPYQNFGRYEGRVSDISQNILTDAEVSSAPVRLPEPAYKVTAVLERQDIDAYGKRVPLQPGMLLKADVILDQRSLMQWFMDPLLSVRG